MSITYGNCNILIIIPKEMSGKTAYNAREKNTECKRRYCSTLEFNIYVVSAWMAP